MIKKSWSGIPARMPGILPPPFPELAFVIRFVLKHIAWRSSPRRDLVLSFLLHVSVLRRLPMRRVLYNDVHFHVKTSSMLRKPLQRLVSDKEHDKRHIAGILGVDFVVPTLAVLRSPEEIDAFAFPERCIIKPTHASAEFISRRDGEALDLTRIKNWLRLDYSEINFEPNYRGLEPKIIVEPWVFGQVPFQEFSILCVEGKACVVYASANRFTDYAVVNFDTQWNELPYTSYEARHGEFEKPKHLAEIISLAERLAKDFFFVRIDTYYDGMTIKCGEITNCPGAALCIFKPRDAELFHSRFCFSDVPEESWNRFFNEE